MSDKVEAVEKECDKAGGMSGSLGNPEEMIGLQSRVQPLRVNDV